MNQDTSTAVRGIIVGLTALCTSIWPDKAVLIAQIGGGLYAVLAFLKPFLPSKIQSQV